jgi:Arc/MetJ-type ribon-helix-helix transcriptional regulator
MAIVTVNISLPDTMKIEVEKIIESEGYGNTSEFFRDLVRNHIKKVREQKLEAVLLESLEGNDMTVLTPRDFDEIKKRGMKKLKKRQKSSGK